MKRPKLEDYFDRDEFSHIQSMAVDGDGYNKALEQYADEAEEEIKQLREQIDYLMETIDYLRETIYFLEEEKEDGR